MQETGSGKNDKKTAGSQAKYRNRFRDERQRKFRESKAVNESNKRRKTGKGKRRR